MKILKRPQSYKDSSLPSSLDNDTSSTTNKTDASKYSDAKKMFGLFMPHSAALWWCVGLTVFSLLAIISTHSTNTNSQHLASTFKGSSIRVPTSQQADELAALAAENVDMFTSFTDDCYMISKQEAARERIAKGSSDSSDSSDQEDDDEEEEEDDDDDLDDDTDDDYHFFSEVGKADVYHFGRCRHSYPWRFPPPGGYETAMDFFFFRDGTGRDGPGAPDWADRDRCFLYCLTQLPADEVNTDLLVEAARMGLPRVSQTLVQDYGIDPVATPSLGTYAYPRPGFNAVQEAIRGGYAHVASILSKNNLDLVIDALGRTVRDYLTMRGCPIRPKDALQYLGLDTTESQRSVMQDLSGDHYAGWNPQTKQPPENRCDIDVVETMTRETFYNDYFMTGRPFVLANAVSEEELATFSKERWSQTETLNLQSKFWVAPQGLPALTGQKYCPVEFTLEQLEQGNFCPATGTTVFRSGNPPSYEDLFPLYENGNAFDPRSVYGHHLSDLFGNNMAESHPNFYLFFGGDDAGVTWHWHNAAFNTCYVGLKQWKLSPPLYRGFTALQSNQAIGLVPEDQLLRCTQTPGMMMYLPDFWGHLIVNSGFAIGTAILSRQPLENLIPPEDSKTFSLWNLVSRKKKPSKQNR